VEPDRYQPTCIVAALTGWPQVLNERARQPQLGESGHHQPRSPIRLLGVTHPEGGPAQGLLLEAKGVLQVEAPDVRAPEEIPIWRQPLRGMSPQPQHARLATPFAARQLFDLYQDERLGSDLQTLTTPQVMFRALLTKDGAQRLELARTWRSGTHAL
jgi:hypothetical protein